MGNAIADDPRIDPRIKVAFAAMGATGAEPPPPPESRDAALAIADFARTA